MANLRKSKAVLKPDGDRKRCKKHPKHRQSPGVCSLCLSEKLSHLSSSSSATPSRKIFTSLSSSSSSSCSSLSSYYSSASSCSSPINPDLYRYGRERRKAPMSSLFKKSRSLAFFRREEDKGKKNGGFWSKFLGRSRRMRMEEALTHSRTMVQRVHG